MSKINFYIVPHSIKNRSKIIIKNKITNDEVSVFCDSLSGNQDPYIWSKYPLWTFCKFYGDGKLRHLRKKVEVGDIIFFCTPDNYILKNMERLYCDFVFIVDSELEWINDLNNAKENVGFPDFSSTEGKDMWESHFKWPSATPPEHYYSPSPKNRKPKKRYTFLANPKESFQTQLDDELIDILPFLKEQTDTETDYWKIKLKNWKSREYTPYEITEATIGYSLKNYLEAEANKKILGCQLESFKQEKFFEFYESSM